MKNPFEYSKETFENEKKPFKELARTDSAFDANFPNRLPSVTAYDFDKIAKAVCNYRSSKKKPLHSADALLILSSNPFSGENTGMPYYCFIEFKNQRVENIQSLKDPDENDLMMKAFDSLAICAMTFTREIAMSELQQNSIFIVVFPKQDYSERFLEALGRLSSVKGKTSALWNLNKLEDNGFFSKVLTLDDGDFSKFLFSHTDGEGL